MTIKDLVELMFLLVLAGCAFAIWALAVAFVIQMWRDLR